MGDKVCPDLPGLQKILCIKLIACFEMRARIGRKTCLVRFQPRAVIGRCFTMQDGVLCAEITAHAVKGAIRNVVSGHLERHADRGIDIGIAL